MAVPLRTRKIVHLAKPGSKVTALLEIHAETGTLLIVDGTPKDNALPGKIAYSFTAAEQESSKIPQLHLLQRPLQKAKPKLKAKLKPKARQVHTPVLLRVQLTKMKWLRLARPRAVLRSLHRLARPRAVAALLDMQWWHSKFWIHAGIACMNNQ